MERHFGLPIAFAAAAHAALLFGINNPPRRVSPPPPDTTPIPVFIAPRVEPPPEVDVGDATERRSAQPDLAKPILPEPAVLPRPDDFHVAPSPPPPIDVTDLKSVPVDPPGRRTPGIVGVDSDIVGPLQLDNPPRTRFQASPVYPFAAKREGLQGEVLVEFTVDESGRVLDPHVVRSTHAVFDEPSLRAISKWQFEPGRRHARVVRFRMSVPLLFRLSE